MYHLQAITEGFKKRRNLAMGAALSGAGIGQVNWSHSLNFLFLLNMILLFFSCYNTGLWYKSSSSTTPHPPHPIWSSYKLLKKN